MIRSRNLGRLFKLGYNRSINCKFSTNQSLIPFKFQKISGNPAILSVRQIRSVVGNIRKTVRNVKEELNESEIPNPSAEHFTKASENFQDEDYKELNDSNELTVPNSSAVGEIEETNKISRLLNTIHQKKDNLNDSNVVHYLKRAAVVYIKENRSESALQEIKNSEEFLILLRNFTKHMKSLHVDEIVDVFWYLRTLKVSNNSIIIQQILRIAREDFNNLSFHKAVFLYFYVVEINDSRDAVAIRAGLEVAFPIIFKKSFDKDNSAEVRDALQLVKTNILPDKFFWPILGATYKFCHELGAKYSTTLILDLLLVLKTLPMKTELYNKCRVNTFEILKKIWQDIPATKINTVLKIYASLVSLDRIKYDSVLIENMTNVVIKSAREPVYKFTVLRLFNFMRHIQYNVLDELTDILIDNPKILDEKFTYCKELIESLARSDYINVRKEKWERLKPIIENLPYLDNESAWAGSDVLLANQLVSLGIYHDKILNFVSDRYNSEKIFVCPPIKLEALLVLNQAIALWYPDFQKPIISQELVSAVLGNHQLFSNEPSDSYVKEALEKYTGVENCVLHHKHTEQGLVISEVVALNDNNEPISFENIPKGISIEEIKSRINCKHMVLLLYEKNLYGINVPVLQELPSLKVKILTALGHTVIPIAASSWFFLSEQEKGIYLWNCIQKKVKNQS